MHEFELIEKIKYITGGKKSVNLGIGDDCAVLRELSEKSDILVTTDILTEGVHFNLSYYSFYDIGYKSAQVNISDIISKGGLPRFAFVSLSIPKEIKEKDIMEWYEGFLEALKPFGVEIAGGDTTSSKNGFFISVTIIGLVEKENAVLRSNAKVNDNIYVLGVLGESDIGLKKLLSGNYNYNDECVKTHLRPKLFYSKWQNILKKYKINSSIDVSDGLLQDLSHIAEESKVHINIFKNSSWNMVNSVYKKYNSFETLISIVSGGEDYAIAFSSSDEIEEENNLIKIGIVDSIINEKNNSYISFLDENGYMINIEKGGYSHF